MHKSNQMHAEIVNQNQMGLYWDMLINDNKQKTQEGPEIYVFYKYSLQHCTEERP